MNLIEWKKMRERVKSGQLDEQDIKQLIENHMIEKEMGNTTEQSVKSEGNGVTAQYQKVMRHPSIPSISPEIEDTIEKAGFSNAILLAIISFLSEILFIGLTILLYK